MTGFARAEGRAVDRGWTWEVRSVNGRGLEIRSRLPAGYEGLEIPIRERVARRFKRGNLWLTLTVSRSEGQSSVRINTEVLDQVLALVPEIQHRLVDFRPASAEGLLALRGVLEPIDDTLSDDERAAFERAVLGSLDHALDSLEHMRQQEGCRLTVVLRDHIERIANLCSKAESSAAAQPAAIFQRLKEQVAALGEITPPLSEERLVQEAALLASRADTREEIDRLKAHGEAARTLLSGEGPAGRRLDFLCQEFNREANTLCAKSSDVTLTRIGLDLKATIDQLREQVQNIE
jgi:uncharacterized protein (TIGR00255 family)